MYYMKKYGLIQENKMHNKYIKKHPRIANLHNNNNSQMLEL